MLKRSSLKALSKYVRKCLKRRVSKYDFHLFQNGLAPLHMASQGDHVDAARILLYHRAPVDEVNNVLIIMYWLKLKLYQS